MLWSLYFSFNIQLIQKYFFFSFFIKSAFFDISTLIVPCPLTVKRKLMSFQKTISSSHHVIKSNKIPLKNKNLLNNEVCSIALERRNNIKIKTKKKYPKWSTSTTTWNETNISWRQRSRRTCRLVSISGTQSAYQITSRRAMSTRKSSSQGTLLQKHRNNFFVGLFFCGLIDQ